MTCCDVVKEMIDSGAGTAEGHHATRWLHGLDDGAVGDLLCCTTARSQRYSKQINSLLRAADKKGGGCGLQMVVFVS